MTKARRTAQMRLARVLRDRNEPHGRPITDESILKGGEVNDSGIVELWVKPPHPHCPCCLDDLIRLREEIASQRGVLGGHVVVVGIPHAERWTAAVNE